MKIYIAAPFAARNVAMTTAFTLEDAGHEITSKWHGSTRDIHVGTVGISPESDDAEVLEHALADLADIDRCDAVLHLTGSYCSELVNVPLHWLHTGGRHVEVGYAIAKGKDVHLIGEPENIFGRSIAYHHESVGAFVSYATLLEKNLSSGVFDWKVSG